MRKYEAMFILSPTLEEEKRKKELEGLKKFLTRKKAEIIKVESLGRKRFSYPIEKFEEGEYVLFYFRSDPSVIKAVKDHIKHNRVILRSMFLVKEKEK